MSAMKDNSRLSKQEGSRQGVVRDLGNGDARARGSDSPAKTKQARPASSGAHAHFPPDLGPVPKASHTEPGNYRSAVSTPAAAHHFPHASHAGNAQVASALTRPAKGEKVELVGRTLGTDKDAHGHTHQMLAPALTGEGGKNGRAPSVMSAVSRKSRYGDNSAEPLWETKKRAWLEVRPILPTLLAVYLEEYGIITLSCCLCVTHRVEGVCNGIPDYQADVDLWRRCTSPESGPKYARAKWRHRT